MTRELATKAAVVFILVMFGAVALKFLFGDPFVPGNSPRFVGFAIALALGILLIGATTAAIVYVFGYALIRLKRHNRGQAHGFEAEPTEAYRIRLNEMDQRLTDVQDILITIDEKLSRLQGNRGTG